MEISSPSGSLPAMRLLNDEDDSGLMFAKRKGYRFKIVYIPVFRYLL